MSNEENEILKTLKKQIQETRLDDDVDFGNLFNRNLHGLKIRDEGRDKAEVQ